MCVVEPEGRHMSRVPLTRLARGSGKHKHDPYSAAYESVFGLRIVTPEQR